MEVLTKMKFYFQTWLSINCALTINSRADELYFGQRIRTNAKENELGFYVFEMTPMQSLQNCVESCKSKRQCKVINYDHLANLCYHVGFRNSSMVHFNVVDFLEEKPGFSYGDKREWDMTGFKDCEKCNEVGVCSENKCKNSGCRLPDEKSHAFYRGNMFSIGNKIEYECKTGYRTNSTVPLTSTCLENGTWSSSGPECLPDAVFADDIHRYDDNFFKILLNPQIWTAANSTCNKFKMHLGYIKTREEHEFLKTILKQYGDNKCYWVGGYRKVPESLFWLDGEKISQQLDWKPGQPDNYNKEQNCVQLIKENSKLNDIVCSDSCLAICELR